MKFEVWSLKFGVWSLEFEVNIVATKALMLKVTQMLGASSCLGDFVAKVE
ncbi:MAG: hypothetical protein QM541_13390 [Flavobacterium sp.]|nr:hypothetical protein [Flavobacterium sp.]